MNDILFDILQIDEKFSLGLYSEGPDGQKGVLGSQITINVTIEKNDDPYGVVGFKSANIIKIMGKIVSFFDSFTNS